MLYKKDHFDNEVPPRNTRKRKESEGTVQLTFSNKSDDLACKLIKEYYGDFKKIENRLPKSLEIGKKIVELVNPLDKNQMSPYTISRYEFHNLIDNTEILDVFRHEIIGVKIKVETNLTVRNPNLILKCEFLFPITYKFIHNNNGKTTHRQYVFINGGLESTLTLEDYYFNQLFERWITGDGKTASLRRADFYREVSPPDQLSSLTQGTPIGRSDNPDGTTPHSALPSGDSSRNIGRPSPDSPNLKYRNLDKSEANGRTPANKLDLGYVHDSGFGSARVIPYDSGFTNNSSPLRNSSALRKSAKNVPIDPELWEEVQALAKGESDKPVVRGENSVNPVNDGKGFTTFPSAYANGWALSQYKRLGGGWKKESAVRVARKWSEEYCKKKDCEDMGFSEKASCRPYKNCYKKASSSQFPPPPPIDSLLKELPHVMFQYENRFNSESEQEALDDQFWTLFDNVLVREGYETRKKELKEISDSLVPLILDLKDHYNLVRPDDLASMKGIPFRSDFLETAQSPSYPSGHTTQAFYLAHTLSEDFPFLSSEFFKIANKVAESRIDRGVHFPSDNEGGRLLAKVLFEGKRNKYGAKRDNPKLKNTGKGGLGTWFAGHGGGKPDDRATWGDWIAITPIKHTVEKEDGTKKEYEAGDIVGPCAISSSKEWAEVTSKGKKPMKCMPREKAYQMSKEDRATLAKKKRREEAKHRGQKPVNTPTFSEEAKDIIKKK